jgi:hypothetical protein
MSLFDDDLPVSDDTAGFDDLPVTEDTAAAAPDDFDNFDLGQFIDVPDYDDDAVHRFFDLDWTNLLPPVEVHLPPAAAPAWWPGPAGLGLGIPAPAVPEVPGVAAAPAAAPKAAADKGAPKKRKSPSPVEPAEGGVPATPYTAGPSLTVLSWGDASGALQKGNVFVGFQSSKTYRGLPHTNTVLGPNCFSVEVQLPGEEAPRHFQAATTTAVWKAVKAAHHQLPGKVFAVCGPEYFGLNVGQVPAVLAALAAAAPAALPDAPDDADMAAANLLAFFAHV